MPSDLSELDYDLVGVTFCGMGFAVGLVRGTVSDELRSAVGQRLAGVENTSRSLFGDGEDSPLRESQRSSRFSSSLITEWH